jgi:hypothetical protein
MSQRTWPSRAASASKGSETDPAGPSAPVPLVPAAGGSAGAGGTAGATGTGQAAGARSRITARGAALMMLGMFLAGDLLAGWAGLSVLTGLTFVAGCLLAAVGTHRQDLLVMVTTPPLIFLVAVVCAETLTSPGSTFAASAGAVAAGTILTLSAAAPWLFGGALLCLIIAMVRGLPQCARDLQANLRGQGAAADRPG